MLNHIQLKISFIGGFNMVYSEAGRINGANVIKHEEVKGCANYIYNKLYLILT